VSHCVGVSAADAPGVTRSRCVAKGQKLK